MKCPGDSEGKESPCNTGDQGWSLGREDPLEKGLAPHSSSLAWENPGDRGAWWATGHGVTKSWTRLRDSMKCQALDSVADLSPSAGERGQQKGSGHTVKHPKTAGPGILRTRARGRPRKGWECAHVALGGRRNQGSVSAGRCVRLAEAETQRSPEVSSVPSQQRAEKEGALGSTGTAPRGPVQPRVGRTHGVIDFPFKHCLKCTSQILICLIYIITYLKYYLISIMTS